MRGPPDSAAPNSNARQGRCDWGHKGARAPQYHIWAGGTNGLVPPIKIGWSVRFFGNPFSKHFANKILMIIFKTPSSFNKFEKFRKTLNIRKILEHSTSKCAEKWTILWKVYTKFLGRSHFNCTSLSHPQRKSKRSHLSPWKNPIMSIA